MNLSTTLLLLCIVNLILNIYKLLIYLWILLFFSNYNTPNKFVSILIKLKEHGHKPHVTNIELIQCYTLKKSIHYKRNSNFSFSFWEKKKERWNVDKNYKEMWVKDYENT